MAHCKYYESCAFLKKYDSSHASIKEKWCKAYCHTGDQVSSCKRFLFAERKVSGFADNLAPNGAYLNSKYQYTIENIDKPLDPKIPSVIFLLNILEALVPLMFQIFLCSTNEFLAFTGAQVLEYYTNPGMLFFFYPLYIFAALSGFALFKSRVNAYVRGEILDNEVLKFVKIWHTSFAIIFSVIPLFQIFTLGFCGFQVSADKLFILEMITLASVGLCALFIHVLFVETSEKFLSFLPFSTKTITMPFLLRFLVVAFFSLFGNVTLVISLVAGSGAENGKTFLEHVLGHTLGMIFLGLTIGLFDLFFLLFSVNKRLKTMQGFGDKLTNGDYTSPPMEIISRDEIGAFMDSLNGQQVQTRALIKTILENIDSTKLISQSLLSNVTETVDTTDTMGKTIDNVRNSMENQSAAVVESNSTINEIVKTIEQLNQSIETQSATIIQSSSSIEEMVSSVRSVSNILDGNSETMKDLQGSSNKAKSLVQTAMEINLQVQDASEGLVEAANVIQNIASQTNLLAMNAAIEAAHAGESGKGFAVVADEIRKLAEESSTQGQTITNTLKSLKEKIASISNATSDVDNQFLQMAQFIAKLDDQERVIQNAMVEQAAGGAEVLNAIKQLNEISELVKSGSAEMMVGSKQVFTEIDKLSEATREINASMDNMLSGTSRIAQSVNEVQEITEANNHSVELLYNLARTFKV